MKTLLLSVCALFLVGCSAHTTSVKLSDQFGAPISNFPLRFELDDGLQHSSALGFWNNDTITPMAIPGQRLSRIGERLFEARTNSEGIASISYSFKERQPSAWRIWLFNAATLPDQSVNIEPLRTLPIGTKISVATPNP